MSLEKSKCINCRAEINSGGGICPYCHMSPYFIQNEPYQPITTTVQDVIDGAGVAAVGLAAIFAPLVVLPAVGAYIGFSVLKGLWRNR